MPKIQFQTNVPVTLSLLSLEGEVVESQFGGNQIKFVAREGPFWVSEAVGSILIDQIRKKHVAAHVPVEVCRREMAQGNGRKGIHWTIDTLGFAPGEQPDGTFVVPAVPVPNGNGANGSKPPAPPAAIASQPHDEHPNGNAPDNGHANGTNGHSAAPPVEDNLLLRTGWAGAIREHTTTLIDLYAQMMQYAGRHNGLVKPDDVRSLLLSAYINVSKGSNGGPR
jgi:hypothetical protein